MRIGRARGLSLLAAALALGALDTEAQGREATAACPAAFEDDSQPPGLIWQGTERLGLRDIALMAAPVLWFSPDEPLLRIASGTIPEAHPCDVPSEAPVVYYQVTALVLSDSGQVSRPEEQEPRFFEKVARMTLKYFFYYRRDFGLGGHEHDLEAVELDVALHDESGCRQVELESATALAHGSRWYSNVLEIEEGTKFPLTLFVEEGKHASAPDRNADGFFTRGYDVTQTVNDAWGVRDVMGSGVLLTSNYSAEMTKPRRPSDRMLPPEGSLLSVPSDRSSIAGATGFLGRYELREGNRVPRCESIPERERLVSFMDYHHVGAESEPVQSGSAGANALKSLRSPERFLSVSLRAERVLGLALVFKGLDLKQAWIVPKVNVSGSAVSVGAMYTPSASRFFDYYLVGGLRRQFEPVELEREIDTPEGPETITFVQSPRSDFYAETGIRIRAQVPSKVRPFALGYSFAGIRVGVQALGLGRLEDIRLVFEIGAGAW